ncbi:hypothetical protein PAMP_020017 [Pampus punctatissimus]
MEESDTSANTQMASETICKWQLSVCPLEDWLPSSSLWQPGQQHAAHLGRWGWGTKRVKRGFGGRILGRNQVVNFSLMWVLLPQQGEGGKLLEREEKGPCRQIFTRSPDRHIRSFLRIIIIHTRLSLRPWRSRGHGRWSSGQSAATGLHVYFSSPSLKRSAAVSGS